MPSPARSKDLKRWDVINELLGTTASKRFLEIGVQSGVCGSKVRATEKWGVDPEPRNGAARKYSRFYSKGSDEFFAGLPVAQQFDVVLVDGLHHAEQVTRDVDNALRHLAPDGFIVMHDCNPLSELAQRTPRQVGVWNGDCWKSMIELRARTDVDAFTIAADHGVGVVNRSQKPHPPAINKPPGLSYKHLESNRDHLLGLVCPELWTERMDGPISVGRVAVVTAIFGQRDSPVPIPVNTDANQHVMFSDCIRRAPGWDVISQERARDPRVAARRIKTLALELVEDAEVIVWIDGRVRPTGVPLRPLLRDALKDADIAGFKHPWRNCAYAEARECAHLGLAKTANIEAQIRAYQSAGMPEKFGLWNTMVLARRRSDEMVKLGRDWWEQIQLQTVRDQVSLPYLLWKNGIRCGRLGSDVYYTGSSPHFERGRHSG